MTRQYVVWERWADGSERVIDGPFPRKRDAAFALVNWKDEQRREGRHASGRAHADGECRSEDRCGHFPSLIAYLAPDTGERER